MLELYFIALAIFGVALLVGCGITERASAKFMLFTCAAIIIGALGFGIQLGRSRGGDYGQGILAVLIFAPIFVSGLGFLASGLIRKHRGKLVIQSAILGLFTIPAGVLAFGIDANERAAELELERITAEMEQADIGGTFGSHYVTIPVAPLISVATICDPPPGVSNLTCHGEFLSKFSTRSFHGHGSTDLEFTYVSVNFPKCEGTRCADIKNWCERRPALKATVWCQSQNSFWLQMRTEAIEPKPESKNPLLVQTDPVDGLLIRCSNQGSKRYCAAYFEVANGIATEFQVSSIEPGNEEMKVRETLVLVENIWTRMTLGPN